MYSSSWRGVEVVLDNHRLCLIGRILRRGKEGVVWNFHGEDISRGVRIERCSVVGRLRCRRGEISRLSIAYMGNAVGVGNPTFDIQEDGRSEALEDTSAMCLFQIRGPSILVNSCACNCLIFFENCSTLL